MMIMFSYTCISSLSSGDVATMYLVHPVLRLRKIFFSFSHIALSMRNNDIVPGQISVVTPDSLIRRVAD